MEKKTKFLNEDQLGALKQFNWNAIPDGSHFRLERSDFKKDAMWEALCLNTKCDSSKGEIVFLFFATKQRDNG